jgi:hypothetical protein
MLQIIHCEFIPKQMEECILEHAAMTVPKPSVSVDRPGALMQIAQEIGVACGSSCGHETALKL